jgi:hypothetical protein
MTIHLQGRSWCGASKTNDNGRGGGVPGRGPFDRKTVCGQNIGQLVQGATGLARSAGDAHEPDGRAREPLPIDRPFQKRSEGMWGSHGEILYRMRGTKTTPGDTIIPSQLSDRIVEVGLNAWREFDNQAKVSCLTEKMNYTLNDPIQFMNCSGRLRSESEDAFLPRIGSVRFVFVW